MGEGRARGDATPPDGHASNAEYVKSVTGGPTAKAWDINFGSLYDQVAAASTPPGDLWCGDEEAAVHLVFWIAKEGGMGPCFYRFAPPARF